MVGTRALEMMGISGLRAILVHDLVDTHACVS
jgi:hypothetical protein